MDEMTPRDRKTYEAKLRRAAARQGLELQKSRARDTRALTYGTYQLVDPYASNVIVAGDHHFGYGLDLAEVEQELSTRR